GPTSATGCASRTSCSTPPTGPSSSPKAKVGTPLTPRTDSSLCSSTATRRQADRGGVPSALAGEHAVGRGVDLAAAQDPGQAVGGRRHDGGGQAGGEQHRAHPGGGGRTGGPQRVLRRGPLVAPQDHRAEPVEV